MYMYTCISMHTHVVHVIFIYLQLFVGILKYEKYNLPFKSCGQTDFGSLLHFCCVRVYIVALLSMIPFDVASDIQVQRGKSHSHVLLSSNLIPPFYKYYKYMFINV